MFRVVTHYKSKSGNRVCFRSIAFKQASNADDLLNELIDTGLFSGGHIEQYVDIGIGWVIYDGE